MLQFTRVEAERSAKDVAYSLLFTDFPIHFFWMNREGVLLGCNQLQLDFLGYAKESDVIGKHVSELAPERPQLWKNSKLCMEQKKRQVLEEVFSTSNPNSSTQGNVVHVLSIKEPIFDELGMVAGLMGIAIDITERKKAECILAEAKQAAESANAAKSAFLANISHEFRTPLTSIVTVAELLVQDPALPSSLVEYVNILKSQGQQLWELTDKLLDYQQIERKGMVVRPERINVVQLIEEVLEPIRGIAEEKGLEVVVDYQQLEESHIKTDRYILGKVLRQVLDNAQKFTSKGQIKVSLKYDRATIGKNAVLEIKIADTGKGIPEEKLKNIFEPFVREGLSDATPYEGVGLGLATVKRCIDVLNGELFVESKESVGSTFRVRVPSFTLAVVK